MIEQEVLKIIENARRYTELSTRRGSFLSPEDIFNRQIKEQYGLLNSSNSSFNKQDSVLYISEDVKIKKIEENNKKHSFKKSIVGSALVFSGQPLIKKRFVTPGASIGTSLASKYLSQVLPQVMPTRVLGTKILGRAIGRSIPYIGWSLIVIDVIELIIEEVELKNNDPKLHFKNGFGGGGFSGGGSGSSW